MWRLGVVGLILALVFTAVLGAVAILVALALFGVRP